MNNELPMKLDYQDAARMAELLAALENPDVQGIKVHNVTFTVYGQHRVTASRGRGRWNRLGVRKIVRIP